jgi:putative ABC transport system permease protein
MRRYIDMLRLRLRSLLRPARADAELQRELQDHLEHLTEEHIRRGLSPREARDAARREFGNVSVTAEAARDARSVGSIENLLRDLRYTLRTLLREPMLLVTATVSIALGAVGNIAVYSLARDVVFSVPDARRPDQLVRMQVSHSSHATYQRWRDLDASGAVQRIAGYSFEEQVNWFNGESAVSLTPMIVTANFFDVVGVPTSLGRTFTEREARAELQPRLAVVTHTFWQQNLGGDSSIVGSTLLFDGEAYTVLGVLKPRLRSVAGFAFSPGVYLALNPSIAPAMREADRQLVSLVGRLRDSQTLAQARAAVDAADRRLARLTGDSAYAGVQEFAVVGGLGSGKAAGVISLFVGLLAVLALIVLLIACANVAGLLIARSTARRRDTAIRLAIGGSRARLLQQFLVEGFWLALIGTAAGVALSVALMRVANSARLPIPIPIELHLGADGGVLAAALGIVLLSTLFCALLPALGATRHSLVPALKIDEPRYVHRRLTPRTLLLAGQVTLSSILLVTALLFVRNLARSQFTHPGFDVDRAVVAQLGFAQRQSSEANIQLLERARERALRLPGVHAVAYSHALPLTTQAGASTGQSVRIGNRVSPEHVEWIEGRVGPGYFDAMKIRLLQGRDFAAADRAGAPAVVIVNEQFARRYLRDDVSIGNRIRFGAGDDRVDAEIVGVVANSKHWTLGEEQRAAMYYPLAQRSGRVNLGFLIVRSEGEPTALAEPLRQALGTLDRAVSVEVQPMREALSFALLPSRIGAMLLGALGMLGLVLAAFGLYAIVAYNVTRRVSELAIRGALGASRGRLLRLVLRDVAAVVAVGVAVGLGVAALITRPLASFLVAGLSTTDPVSFGATAVLFVLVSALAGLVPARRATRISPAIAMRAE